MGRWRGVRRVASVAAFVAVSIGGGVAAADELVVTVWSDQGGAGVELCAEDPDTADPADVRDPEAVGAQLADRFPQALPASLDPGWGCAWLDLEVPREQVPTGDGYRDLLLVPELSDLGGPQGYGSPLVFVCGPMLDVEVAVEPQDAVLRSGGCVDGRGVELDPHLASEVALTVRATDALLRTTAVAGVGLFALLLATAALLDRHRGWFAVRLWDHPGWRRWSEGISLGVVVGVGWSMLAMMAGPLDALEMRVGFDAAFAVVLLGPVVFLPLSIWITARIERARTHPSVRRHAERRFLADVPGFDVAADEVPAEVASLPPPPAIAVPDTPWMVFGATYAPAVLLWAAAAVGLEIVADISLVLPASLGLLGAALAMARARLIATALPTEALDPVRRAELLAALAERGTAVGEVVRSRAVLPVYDEESFPPHGLWLGRLLVLGPALRSCSPRRAALLAVAAGTSAHGLTANLSGAVALSAVAVFEQWPSPWWWIASLPLLTTTSSAGVNVRRWWRRRGALDRLDGAEIIALAVESEWWSLATLAGLGDDEAKVEIARLWPASVLRMEAVAEEEGLPGGRAIATARQLADGAVDAERSH